jgi:hypothetical protein
MKCYRDVQTLKFSNLLMLKLQDEPKYIPLTVTEEGTLISSFTQDEWISSWVLLLTKQNI